MVTKCNRLGGLKNRYVFLMVLDAEKSKIKVPAGMFLLECPLLDLHMVVSSLCTHTMERVQALVTLWGLESHMKSVPPPDLI